MDISYDLLKVFKEVAYYESVSKAAQKLCVTQPSVTKSIKKLESQLNLNLFVREKKGLVLSDDGKRLYKYILDSINNARYSFPERYLTMPGDAIRLYLDNAIQEDFEQEIFMDINLSHYPLRDYAGMISEMQSIIRSYGKIGKRNKRAIEHDKIGKHMLHLIRLFLMCFDILEKEEINTYRTNDIEFLLSIKNGLFLDSNMQPTKEFYEYINSLEQRLQYAAKYTNLPEVPNYKEINDFKASVNERIILGGI